MSDEKSHVSRFHGEIGSSFRKAVVGKDSLIQKRGEFFVTVEGEAGSETTFGYRVRFKGKFHSIDVTYVPEKQVRIETSVGSVKLYSFSDLNKSAIEDIIADWLSEIEGREHS